MYMNDINVVSRAVVDGHEKKMRENWGLKPVTYTMRTGMVAYKRGWLIT